MLICSETHLYMPDEVALLRRSGLFTPIVKVLVESSPFLHVCLLCRGHGCICMMFIRISFIAKFR